MTRDEVALEDALFSSPARRTKWITIREGEEFGLELPVDRIAPISPDSPALTAALEAMAEAGRKSNGFGDRRLPWLRALDDYLESRA
jgi:hypothetical protein